MSKFYPIHQIPPGMEIPATWVKCIDGSSALVPTAQVEEFIWQDKFNHRLMTVLSIVFQVVLFGAVIFGPPAFALYLFLTR